MQNSLHIVSFDVPYPADYGGAIDVFYKVKALHGQGCKIYLHCYEYGRGEAHELNPYCEEVWYYKRTTGIAGISLSKPYIVSSRCAGDLLKRLKEIDAPVLFEGVHTTFFLRHPALVNRFKAIRIHNIEHQYYQLLAQKTKSLFEKVYFLREAALLHKYERDLNAAQAFYALSAEDHRYFKDLYPAAQHAFIPPFHQYDEVNILVGKGDYCLYHGNLSHPENIEAALYLLRNVFPNVTMPFIIAGKNPNSEVIAACNTLKNGKLIANPTKAEMDDLVANAHIHILPTFQQSGMKLKLLSALYGGRHVIVNKQMLYGTGMPEDICTSANSDLEFIHAVNHLKDISVSATDIAKRKELLAPYDNVVNAKRLLQEVTMPLH